MYNEDLKNRFIQEYTDKEYTADRMRSVFKAIEKYETIWNADLCTRTKDELSGVIENVLGVRTSNRLTVLSALRKYAQWCMDNNVPGACDGLLQIRDIGLQKIVSEMVGDPKQLQSQLDKIFPPEQDGRLDNVYRCFFWMAFSGVAEDDAVLITSKDIDPWKRLIKFNGKEYPIYEEAVPVFSHLYSANCFLCDFVRYEKIVERADGELLLRGTKDSTILSSVAIQHSASRKMRQVSKVIPDIMRLKYRNVQLSGIFYRAYEIEKETGKYDFTPVIEPLFNRKQELTDSRKRQVKREYETDYLRWKAAFGK